MRHEIVPFDLVFRFVSPLIHAEGTDGNASILRRIKVVLPDGQLARAPALSGNAIKHAIRDAGVRDMLVRLGRPDLSRAAIQLLFSGGSMTLRGSTVDVERMRRLSELVPILGICGGAAGNTMQSSHLRIGWGYPACAEHARSIPWQRMQRAGVLSEEAAERLRSTKAGRLTEIVVQTRHDPLRDPTIRALLPTEQRLALDAAQSERLARRQTGEIVAKDADSVQMVYEYEVLAAGTVMVSQCSAVDLTDAQLGALWAALARWAQQPFVGGRRAVGFGQFELTVLTPAGLERPTLQWDAAVLPVGAEPAEHVARAQVAAYCEAIDGRRDEIVAAIEEVAL